MAETHPDNEMIADILERVAQLLEVEGKNPFRVRSYRNAAQAVRDYGKPVARMVEGGKTDELRDIPGVGPKISGAIEEIALTGRLGLLDDLESDVTPSAVLRRVPGIGEKLATRIHRLLGVESLEELEIAAHDGSLAELEGVGEKKMKGIRNALAGMLSRSAARRSRERQKAGGSTNRPDVRLILKIDAEYRRKAEAGELRKISPRRFNPGGKAWLPILNTRRSGYKFTALYSNTSRAHELGKTHDWVVIYHERDGRRRQNTVVTAQKGPLQGRRVVRGREKETREYYDV